MDMRPEYRRSRGGSVTFGATPDRRSGGLVSGQEGLVLVKCLIATCSDMLLTSQMFPGFRFVCLKFEHFILNHVVILSIWVLFCCVHLGLAQAQVRALILTVWSDSAKT